MKIDIFCHIVPQNYYERMLKLPEAVRKRYDLSSLETAVHAAAPCPVPVKEQMIAWWGPIILEYYGMTEAIGFSACDSAEWLAHRGTVGKVVFGRLHVLDADMKPCPPERPARCGSTPARRSNISTIRRGRKKPARPTAP
jgi:long-chain acyl-CoA synthetase